MHAQAEEGLAEDSRGQAEVPQHCHEVLRCLRPPDVQAKLTRLLRLCRWIRAAMGRIRWHMRVDTCAQKPLIASDDKWGWA